LELKEKISGGVRVYLGEDGNNLIILLLGGDKSSQKNDISKAMQYWQEYKSNK
jgi:putative addiction module killer protein